MFKKIIFILVITLSGCASADLPITHDLSKDKNEIAKEVFFGSDVLDIDEYSSSMTKMLLTRQPQWGIHKALIKDRATKMFSSDSYQNKVANIIANNFTETELLELKELMKNPVMKKWNKKFTEFLPEVTMATTDHFLPEFYNLMTAIREEDNYLSKTEEEVQLLNNLNSLIRSNNCSDAIALSEKKLMTDANSIHAIYAIGFCYQVDEQYEKALSLLLDVYKLNPRHRHINYNLAKVLLILNKDEDALKHANMEVELYPENSNSFYMLAKVHGYIGNKEESLKSFDKSLQLNPKNIKSLLDLAFLYLHNGDKIESCDILKKAELINPSVSELPINKEACGS